MELAIDLDEAANDASLDRVNARRRSMPSERSPDPVCKNLEALFTGMKSRSLSTRLMER